ncbi:DUF692 domain-containing protein [Idiomarina aminovorans]|uniref:DUF692 domain-containing protein n=1 Tax=Idiomarina aminovorans TaxID=2914829 RepID=UPI0020058B9F|nr:DUF692 domain-containing protein [Idiomarina sp. ATCH4]MCK7458018.1 DUF692 domain-containing protein [Idiomarina sp. ATCH4]
MTHGNQNLAPAPPRGVGLSFKADFYDAAMKCEEKELWFEVHTENYCSIGGPRKRMLKHLSERFPLSFHGVAGSLGNRSGQQSEHLQNVQKLVGEFEPALVSEHVAWSVYEHEYLADLLPIKRSHEALKILVDNINRYQNAIGRPILVENPTHYVTLEHEQGEPEFLTEVARRSGCGLLIDITNLYLSEVNCGINAANFIQKIPANYVGEIHVAGFEHDKSINNLLIDSHSQAVPEPIKELLKLACQTWGNKPTLLERDANLPAFNQLLAEGLELHRLKQEYCDVVT